MASLIIHSKIFVNRVLMVVKLVMTKDMINVLLVNLIQIHQPIINKRVKIYVLKHVQLDNLDRKKLIDVRSVIIHV